MNKTEFLNQLASQLSDISPEEREEALSYYREYIEDAGLENEEALLNELGSPQKVASDIKKDIYQKATYTSDSQSNAIIRHAEVYTDNNNTTQERAKNSNNTNLVLILILAVLLAPFWIPFVITVISVIFSVIVTVLSIGFGIGISGIALLIVGVVLFALGIYNMFLSPFIGILLIGISMLIFSLGILFTLFTGWICGKALPWIVKQLSVLWHRITPPRKGAHS